MSSVIEVMNKSIYLLIIIISLNGFSAFAQVNIMGKPGYINNPSAEWFSEQQLGFSFSYIPDSYSLFKMGSNKNAINFYNVRASLTSFMDVNLSLAYRPEMKERIGVGDRQLDFRFRVFTERKYMPSIVVGLTLPGSRLPILAHDYIVATKNMDTKVGAFQVSIGYGMTRLWDRERQEDNEFWKSLRYIDKKSLYRNDYLYGAFGAISYHPVKFGGVMMEYDSNTINASIFVKPLNWMLLQLNTYEAKEWAFSAGLNFSLNNKPNFLRRYENKLD